MASYSTDIKKAVQEFCETVDNSKRFDVEQFTDSIEQIFNESKVHNIDRQIVLEVLTELLVKFTKNFFSGFGFDKCSLKTISLESANVSSITEMKNLGKRFKQCNDEPRKAMPDFLCLEITKYPERIELGDQLFDRSVLKFAPPADYQFEDVQILEKLFEGLSSTFDLIKAKISRRPTSDSSRSHIVEYFKIKLGVNKVVASSTTEQTQESPVNKETPQEAMEVDTPPQSSKVNKRKTPTKGGKQETSAKKPKKQNTSALKRGQSQAQQQQREESLVSEGETKKRIHKLALANENTLDDEDSGFSCFEDAQNAHESLTRLFKRVQATLMNTPIPDDDIILLIRWSLETLVQMYEETQCFYEVKMPECPSYTHWVDYFNYLHVCPFFEIVETIFLHYFYQCEDDPLGVAKEIVNANETKRRNFGLVFLNHYLWNNLAGDSCTDLSLKNHFAILEEEEEDDDSMKPTSGLSCGNEFVKIYLNVINLISDDEPDTILRSCMANVPLFLNLLVTSRELLNSYMSQLDTLLDQMLKHIIAYPSPEQVITRMYDILQFSKSNVPSSDSSSIIEIVQEHILALFEGLHVAVEDFYLDDMRKILQEKDCEHQDNKSNAPNCHRFVQGISDFFVAKLLFLEVPEGISQGQQTQIEKFKLGLIQMLCVSHFDNLRISFKADIITWFLTRTTKDLKNPHMKQLFFPLTKCYTRENLVDLFERVFMNIVRMLDVQKRQRAFAYFASLLIYRKLIYQSLYKLLVRLFPLLFGHKDYVCVYHNLRLLDTWSDRHFRSTLPDHKDYSDIFPTLVDTYFDIVERISSIPYKEDAQPQEGDVYLKILCQIQKYCARFTGLKICEHQLFNSLVKKSFKVCDTMFKNDTSAGCFQKQLVMSFLKRVTSTYPYEQDRVLATVYVNSLQEHFLTNDMGFYNVQHLEYELKMVLFFKKHDFFLEILRYASRRHTLRWYHHLIRCLLQGSIFELQSFNSTGYENYAVTLFELFSNGEYFSRSFISLVDLLRDFKTFTRSEQVTILEETLRVFARYGADIRNHWKLDFIKTHFSQTRMLLTEKVSDWSRLFAELEQWKS